MFNSCDDCYQPISGCTDPSADNYNPQAESDDGSCSYCGDFQAYIIGTSSAMPPNFNNGSIQATGINGSGNYSIEVVNSISGTTQNPFALIAGNYNVIVNDELLTAKI